MKVKISTSPNFIIIYSILILDFGFTSILNIPVLGVYANYTLVITIAIFLMFFNTIVNNNIYNTLKPYRNYTNAILIIISVFIVVVTLYSYNKYGQRFINYYSCFRTYLYLFLAVPLIFVFTKQNGYEYFLKALTVLTVVYLVFCFINSFYFTLRGSLLFENLTFGLRNDRLRCQVPSSFYIIMPYVLNKIFDEKLNKDKLKWVALFGFFVFFIYYVCMTRMITVALYALIAVTLVVRPKDPNIRRTILILYAIVFIILIVTGQVSNILEYFQSRDETFDQSTIARQKSLQYFRGIAAANPILSMGFVSPTNDYFASIYFGPKLNCFYDDLGISNIYLHYGLFGVVVFSFIILRFTYLFIKIYFINKSEHKALFAGIVLFIIFTQVSLSMFDGQRIMGASVLWALFEYEAYTTSATSQNDRKKRIQIRRNNENHTIQLRMDKSRR